jgi:hypothetical protein
MADSATNIPQVSQAQAGHDVVVNALVDALGPASIFGRNFEATAALTWGYLGGKAPIEGTPVAVDNGTVALTASTTNYVYADIAGSPAAWVVVVTTSAPGGWPGPLSGDKVALYTIVTGPSTATSFTDHRHPTMFVASVLGGGATSPGGSDTQVQFNDSGSFGGDAGLTFNKTTNDLTVSGDVAVGTDLSVGGDAIITDSLSADEITATNGVSVGSGAINAQTGTSYTLLAADNGKIITLSNASAITLTVPASLGAGFSCMLIQLGAGTVTVTPSSTTVNSAGGLLDLNGQHAAASLVAYAANVFNLAGNLA